MLLVWGVATLLAFSLSEYGVRTENLLLVYLGGVVLVILETKSLAIGISVAVLSAASFNFMFTEPKYTFIIDDPNYFISMILFIILSIVINTLLSRLQTQITISEKNEKRIEAMYELSKILMNQHTIEAILQEVVIFLQKQTNQLAYLSFRISTNQVFSSSIDDKNIKPIDSILQWAFQQPISVQKNQLQSPDNMWNVYPFQIKHTRPLKGVLFLDRTSLEVSENKHDSYIEVVISHMMIALSREMNSMEKELTRLQMEKEKFKTALLRSVSHDIKTPLTSLCTGTSILMENYQQLSNSEIKSMLGDMNTEALQLSEFVDNLLNLTKIESNKLVINKKTEMIEELLGEVFKRISRRIGMHTFEIFNNSHSPFVYCEPSLLIQVLVNLIDNAIKHTPSNSMIQLIVQNKDNQCMFLVEDNGGGIHNNKIKEIFENEYDFDIIDHGKNLSGLGLSICRSIIHAHNGSIHFRNNDKGGATFEVSLPYEEV